MQKIIINLNERNKNNKNNNFNHILEINYSL